jgi:hypothetical protein
MEEIGGGWEETSQNPPQSPSILLGGGLTQQAITGWFGHCNLDLCQITVKDKMIPKVYLHRGASCSYFISIASKLIVRLFQFQNIKLNRWSISRCIIIFHEHKKTCKHETKVLFPVHIAKWIVQVRHSIPIYVQLSKQTSIGSISSKSPGQNCGCMLTLQLKAKLVNGTK